METDFVGWIQSELARRGWNQAELVRRGGISDSQLSRVILGTRAPGLEFLRGLAQAFDLPVEAVFRRAGWLPEEGELLPEVRDWSARLRAFTPARRAAVVAAIENVLRLAEDRPVRA